MSRAANNATKPNHGRRRAVIVHSVFLTLALFVFWVVLSGKMEARYLIIGLVTALIITWSTRRLVILPPERDGYPWLSLWDLPWLRIIAFAPWLLWQIVVANVHLAMIVLNPKLPVDPQVVRFRKHIPHPVGRFALANSITLTPGTITLFQDEDEYMVHCVKKEFAAGVTATESPDSMPARVAAVFGEQAAPDEGAAGGKGR